MLKASFSTWPRRYPEPWSSLAYGVGKRLLAITRERERGTMENLLSTPAFPGEVMFGKIVPYILVGYIQMGLILLAARYIFQVPASGNLFMLAVVALLFIAANLSVGLTFSTLARNQLQAVQMSFFFFLPSILLSGFMFPFRGMPVWAQWLGEVLPPPRGDAAARHWLQLHVTGGKHPALRSCPHFGRC